MGPGDLYRNHAGLSWLGPEAEAEAAFSVPRNQAQCLGALQRIRRSLVLL